jgi:putative tricarboxylic transport membrane protein
MEVMDNFFVVGLQEITWGVLILIFIGTLGGIIAGAIPGFTVAMGIVVVFPFTFGMDAVSGLALMISVMVGGYSGGLISGIMLGIPGTPSSIATVFDGYPMAKNGEPGRALGIGISASFFGCIFSILMLSIFGPLVAQFSLKFGPWEITALIIFALTLVGSLSQGALLKGCIAGAFGVLIATTGIAPGGQVRFNFGLEQLSAGINMMSVLIGAFAFSQLMQNVEELSIVHKEGKKDTMQDNIKIPYLQIAKDLSKQKLNLFRSSIIGSVIGTIPAVGGSAANFISYDQAKKFSKHPEKFGSGIPDGIIAPESSNNALIGGALIPTLTLGIPGNLTMAIMLGVMILHGVTPGPRLFVDQPILIGSIYVSILISAIFMIMTMLLLIRLFAKISNVPQNILIPIVLMLASVGSYALNNSLFDVWTLFLFGIVGYLFTKVGVPLTPLILGVVLGNTLEVNFFRALELDSSWTTFLTRPISATLLGLTLLSIGFIIWQNRRPQHQK